jgi:hypothetical protein
VTEAEVVAAFATLGQAYLAGLQTSFAIVSAYIVALYFFLGRAPLALRALAFVFFSATLAVLGGYLAGAMLYGQGIAGALGELRGKRSLSTLGTVVAWLMNHPHTATLVFGSLAIGLGTYLALFYLTFFYRWRTPSDGAALDGR